MQTTATYSPEDNKLRLYSPSRLDSETYTRVKQAGFIYAPKQGLFVAPMWTPHREDFLIDLCGAIDDEDRSLVERAEERSERFGEYSDNRAADAESAHKTVAAIADGIPFGQPILIGHHSERRARRDAQRIEDEMRRAVKMWDTATYWTDRAAGAIRHAKHKQQPAVRARRIKGLEADQRRYERSRKEADMWLKLWTECANEQDKSLQADVALRIAGMCHLRLPRKAGDREDFTQNPSAYDALRGSYPNLYAPRTVDEVLTAALHTFPRMMTHDDRWLTHILHRLTYERAMLAASGGTAADQTKPEKHGACRCWASPRGGWSYIQKVNKVSVTVLHTYGNGGKSFKCIMPFDKLTGLMTAADVEAKRDAGALVEAAEGIGFFLNIPQPQPAQLST